MEPVYMNMNSFPHQDQMCYRPRCHSGMEARPPMSYGCWPWSGSYGCSYGYAPPGACHGCPNHAYMPSHSAWGSPFYHLPPHHCPGNYPYPTFQYTPPPPYNVMEHPRYEYEKNMPAEGNCCGCPGHQKEQRNVRIEEEEPEKERKKDDSLAPLHFRNMPYPIMWLPPDGKDRSKVKDKDACKDDSRDMKVLEDGNTVEQQQPTSWKGWLPIALNNVVPPKDRGNKEENHHEDNGKKNPQFPLVWIPYKPDDVEREIQKVKDVDAKPSWESGKALDDGASKGNVGDHTASKVKDIPVKEVAQHVGEKCSAVQEKERSSSVGSQRKSQSPPKSSKLLPPVCLRVDPLPRKKSVSTKSRSPSPPGDKQKLEVKSKGASKGHSSDNEERVKEDKGTKTIVVDDESVLPVKNLNVETYGKLDVKPQDDDSVKQAEEKPEEEHIAQKQTEYDAVMRGQSENTVRAENELLMTEGVKMNDVKKRRELSEEEAAVIIQSAYRRFDVCRWEPIKKLKQIAGVREQIAGVKRQIQELELFSDVQGRRKQKNIIAETIMSLLLKLDVIQGLHPSIREVRKSVVRELVGLQEKLDELVNEKPENLPAEEPMMGHEHKDASNKSGVAISSENDNEVDLQKQTEEGPNSESRDLSEANMIEEAASAKIGKEAAESSVDEVVESAENGTNKDEDKKSSEVLEYNENPSTRLGPGDLQDSQASVMESAAADHDVLHSELVAELPHGVLDDLSVTESTHQSASNADESMQPEDALIGLPIAQESYHGVSNKENDETSEVNEASDRVEPGTEETELGNSQEMCKADYKLQEADRITRDAGSEPDECTAQQLEDFIGDVIVRSEASVERDEINDEYSGATEKDVSSELVQEGDLDETDVINECANTCDAVDMTGAERQAEAKHTNDGGDTNITKTNSNQYGGVSEESLPEKVESEGEVDATPEMEEQCQERNTEDLTETNKRLMEENERLRDMMEKLIKSGQQQLMAISSLSGRVRDMEKQLYRKRKLKVKQSKAPKAGGKTIGVVM